MNRILSLFLIFSLLLAMVGCTGQAAQNNVNEAPQQAEPVAPPEPPVPAEPETQTEPETEPEPVPEEPYVRVVDPAKPMVALTFDDGPHPVHSQTILDILEENHAVATFFEQGRSVARYPEVLPRMVELGCEIGSHSNSHKDLSKLKQSGILKDLQTADEAFLAAAGTAPTLMRPPYGAVNDSVKNATGRAVVTWTVDTMDWSSRDTDTIVKYVQGLEDLDGEIVLLHSIYESTAEAARILVPWLIEQGYQLVTVSELMAYYYGELPQPDHFYGYSYFASRGRTDTPLQLPTPAEPTPEAGEALPEEPTPTTQGA